MTCNKQVMWKVGIGMLAALAISFAALPELRAWLLAALPTLVLLLCPLSMLVCMKMMHGEHSDQPQTQTTNLAPSTMSHAEAKRT